MSVELILVQHTDFSRLRRVVFFLFDNGRNEVILNVDASSPCLLSC